MIILKKKDFRLDFEWDWKEFGLGCIVYKPLFKPYPRKVFWIGFSFRLLWFGIFIKLWDRKPVKTNLEIYEQKERMKELSAFHHKELIVFKNRSSLDVYWQWNHLGMMIYYRSQTACRFSPGDFSMNMLWFSVSFYFRQKPLLT